MNYHQVKEALEITHAKRSAQHISFVFLQILFLNFSVFLYVSFPTKFSPFHWFNINRYQQVKEVL